MKKTLLLCGALLALTASVASAAPAINLAWSDCVDGVASTLNRNFACTTNSNAVADVAVASFIAPAGMDLFISLETTFEFAQGVAGPVVPWWQWKGTGRCHNGGLSLNNSFGALAACDQGAWSAVASGGVGAMLDDNPSPGRSQGNGVLAVSGSSATALVPDVHYYGLNFAFSHAKTVGTGACTGCSTPVCFRLKSLKTVQPANSPGGNVEITTEGTRAYVTYQGATEATCILATPTRNKTWGAVKALYR
jgi:hypothetical protein